MVGVAVGVVRSFLTSPPPSETQVGSSAFVLLLCGSATGQWFSAMVIIEWQSISAINYNN